MQQKDKVLYFRRKNKTSYSVNFKKNASYRSLQLLLSKREGIDVQNIVFIHHGKVLQSTFPFQQLQNKSIIHVIDLNQVKKEFLQLNFKYLDGTAKKFRVGSSDEIQQFIKNNLAKIELIPYFYIGLIYGGKILSPLKTFQQEYVQNLCQITVIDISKYKISQTTAKVQIQNPEKEPNQGNQDRHSNMYMPVEDNNNLINSTKRPTENVPDQNHISENCQSASAQENKQFQDAPLFSIRVSEVHSISTEQNLKNNVSYNEHFPFQTIPSVNQEDVDDLQPKMSDHHPKPQALGQSQLSMNDFIYIGSGFENQTKSFIQNLMKKYKIVLQPKP